MSVGPTTTTEGYKSALRRLLLGVNRPKPRKPTLSVESLLAETSILESALHATRYTAATCPLSEATNLPVLPSQILTALSNPAEAIHLPSGEKATWLTCFWWPVRRARGFFGVALDEKEEAAWSGQRKSVWSSEPVISVSGCVETRSLYRARASDLARGPHQRRYTHVNAPT